MILKKINIRNFRCFESYEMLFASETTVLIGKNGSGKTNLITALKKGISFIFSKNKLEALQNISTSGDLHVAKFDTMDARYDTELRDFVYPIEIECQSIQRQVKPYPQDESEFSLMNWALVKATHNGSLLYSKYQEALKMVLDYYNQAPKEIPLPLLVYFSDSYPHKKISVGAYAKSVLKMDGLLPRNFGYYMWDAETNCAEIWHARYVKIYNSINDNKKSEEDKSNKELEEMNFIDKRMITFTQPLREEFDFVNTQFAIHKIFVTRPQDAYYRIQFAFKDGRKMFFEELPQGYNRLLSIVFDIAYRSYILNDVKEPEGIVLIDEVELHLHPSLAQEVLERLRKTFPLIQFIVSTHSPLVISNLKQNDEKNKIIKLLNNEGNYLNEPVENIYGVDYITGLMMMDSKYRISTIDKLIDAIVRLKTRNKEVEAVAIRAKLDEIVGANNRLIDEEINKKLKSNQ